MGLLDSIKQNKTKTINLPVLFVTGMLYAVQIDGSMTQQDVGKLKGIFEGKVPSVDDLLKEAVDYQTSTKHAEYLNELQNMELESSQRICFMANLLDLLLVDGELHENEIVLYKTYSDAIRLTGSERGAIQEVIVAKNSIGDFQ